MPEPFAGSRQHLYAELRRLDLLIQREVWRWRQMNSPDPQAGDEFRGLYVSEAEVDAILRGIYPGSELVLDRVAGQDAELAFNQAIDLAAAEIAQHVAASASRGRGTPSRLSRLQAMFGLARADVDALLICLAPEIDLRYERLYAYLQDDVTRKRPGVSLILNLLCATPGERLTLRRRFLPGAPLLGHRLLVLFEDPSVPHPPLLARYAKPDPRIVEYLLAEGERQPGGARCTVDARLQDTCELDRPDMALDALHLPPSTKTELARLILSRELYDGDQPGQMHLSSTMPKIRSLGARLGPKPQAGGASPPGPPENRGLGRTEPLTGAAYRLALGGRQSDAPSARGPGTPERSIGLERSEEAGPRTGGLGVAKHPALLGQARPQEDQEAIALGDQPCGNPAATLRRPSIILLQGDPGTGNAPVLGWTGETGYSTDGANPDSAAAGSDFEFRVEYSDSENDAPALIQLWIDENADGIYSSTEKYAMTEDGGGADYTVGRFFSSTLTFGEV